MPTIGPHQLMIYNFLAMMCNPFNWSGKLPPQIPLLGPFHHPSYKATSPSLFTPQSLSCRKREEENQMESKDKGDKGRGRWRW